MMTKNIFLLLLIATTIAFIVVRFRQVVEYFEDDPVTLESIEESHELKSNSDPDPEDAEAPDSGDEDKNDGAGMNDDPDFGDVGFGSGGAGFSAPGLGGVVAGGNAIDIGNTLTSPSSSLVAAETAVRISGKTRLPNNAKQLAEIALQPDYFINDLLYFAKVDKYVSKRLICVMPDSFKELYIVHIQDKSDGVGLLVGSDDEGVVLDEVKPKDLRKILIYDKSISFENYFEQQSIQYVLFYDTPVSASHGFFTWLNSNLQIPVAFVNYFDVMEDRASKAALMTKYPYFRLETRDAQKLLPGRSLKRRFITTLLVNNVVYSNKQFKESFYKVYDDHFGKREYQMFYELFFDFYPEILQKKVGVDASVKLKSIGMKETFKQPNNKRMRAYFEIREPMKTIKLASSIRNEFVELVISRAELDGQLNAKFYKLDKILLSNQKHRTLDGEYYIASKDKKHVLLQSRILIKLAVDLKMLNDSQATCANIDTHFAFRLKKHDAVFIKQIDKSAVFIAFKHERYYFQIMDTFTIQSRAYRCVTNSTILLQKACESEFDSFGKKKTGSPDIWDRPCAFDTECPFFGKGSLDEFRGGCMSGGFCEMPMGYKNVSNRYYTKDLATPVGFDDIRFDGDLYGVSTIS
jgi:hypothetical protein